MALGISLAVCDYDRTRAIFDGRAPIEGCDVTTVALAPEESFHRAFKFQEFDISELSLSSYTLQVARGDNAELQDRRNRRRGATTASESGDFAVELPQKVVGQNLRILARKGAVATKAQLAAWVSAWPDLCVVTVDYGERLAAPGAENAPGAAALRAKPAERHTHQRFSLTETTKVNRT